MTRISLVRSIPHFRLLLVMVAILPAVSLLAGCSSSPSSFQSNLNQMAPISTMPAEVQQAPSTVQAAYQFAVANPGALKNVPCYCGCVKVGHTSNYSCFVQEMKPSGEMVFNQHALGCSICVDIAQDVMKMTQAGKAPTEIRTAIDQTFSQYGPSNMSPAQ
jgi:outer membrane murein-binding lipoprotein Lpp